MDFREHLSIEKLALDLRLQMYTGDNRVCVDVATLASEERGQPTCQRASRIFNRELEKDSE